MDIRLFACVFTEARYDAAFNGLAVLQCEGLGRLSRLEPPEPPNRYERSRPGELIHIDVKKLGRILKPRHRVTGNRRGAASTHRNGKAIRLAGWEFVHIAIDDHSRLAYAEVLADQRGETAVGFLRRAVAFFTSHKIGVQRVMTDNGSPTSLPFTLSSAESSASAICAPSPIDRERTGS